MAMLEALNGIKKDCASEKWNLLLISTIGALDALENKTASQTLPNFKLREIILAPIQMALESSNKKLNTDALIGLQAFINEQELYNETNTKGEEDNFTYQFLNAIWPCNVYSEILQSNLLKLLLKLCLSQNSKFNVNSMLRTIQICTDVFTKFTYNRGKEAPIVARMTLVQAIEAFVQKNNAVSENNVPLKTTQYMYRLLNGDDEYVHDVSEPQLQTFGVLKCIIDHLSPQNITSHNRISVPMFLESIATIISLLPSNVINHRSFLKIIWQRLCPMMMLFLSNQKEERQLTSTLCCSENVSDLNQGSACSVAAPDLWPEALRYIYQIVVHLTFLVGPVRELRPMLESLYHKMLLYPPPNHRLDALRAVNKILESTEGVLCIAGPLISIPMLKESLDELGEQRSPAVESSCIMEKPDFRLLTIILDSIHVCSSSTGRGDQHQLICVSAQCVNSLVASISELLRDANEYDKKNRTFLNDEMGFESGSNHDANITSNSPTSNTPILAGSNKHRNASIDAGLPRTLDVDRWAAHDYLLSLTKIIPSLLDATSIEAIDHILLSFSSNYCKDRQSTLSDGVMSPTETDDLYNAQMILETSGTLLNADAVYSATFSVLSLNFRLLKEGFYSAQDQTAMKVMTEAEFIESVLGMGLLLYVSETWLSQVYREIRKQDLLSISVRGFNPLLLSSTASILETCGHMRGTCLVEMLTHFDGIGWEFQTKTYSPNTKDDSARKESISSSEMSQLITSVLDMGWDRIVETLTNAVASTGMKIPTSGRDACLFFFGPAIRALTIANENTDETTSKESSGKNAKNGWKKKLPELEMALVSSLTSLQQVARLACQLSLQGPSPRCSRVFALLIETARITMTNNQHGNRHRLHSAQALSLHAVLSTALELGCNHSESSLECWIHLLNACRLVGVWEYTHFCQQGLLGDQHPSSVVNSEGAIDSNGFQTVGLPAMVHRFCQANLSASTSAWFGSGREAVMGGGLLTFEQTGTVLVELSRQVDRIFECVADHLSLPALTDFVYCLLQASKAELANRSAPDDPRLEWEDEAELTKTGLQTVVAKVKQHLSSYSDAQKKDQLTGSHPFSIFLDRLSHLLLRLIQSPRRPQLHLLRCWSLVSQHLVDACCFSSGIGGRGGEANDDLFVRQKALNCLQECVTRVITTRHELPYFSANEMYCKPFELLLRLELCNGELQDRIISCLGEVVEESSALLHSGWRPIFNALRSIRITFLLEPFQVSAESPQDFKTMSSLPTSNGSKFKFDDVRNSTKSSIQQQRIITVLEIFKIFLTSNDMLVFGNTAVDCVRCLLCYISVGELQVVDFISIGDDDNDDDDGLALLFGEMEFPKDVANGDNSSLQLPPFEASISKTKKAHVSDRNIDSSITDASFVLCNSTMPLLTCFCEVLEFLWKSPSTNYSLRSAKRQAYMSTGGPPQFSLLPGVRDFSCLSLLARIKNLTPWFSTERLLEPVLDSQNEQFSVKFWTLRSLDDIDHSSGVLHLWFFLLEGVLSASWRCNVQVYRIVFEEFVSLLNSSVDAISGSANVKVMCLSDQIEKEENVFNQVALGASFAVFVLNHVLLPKLQTAVFACTSSEQTACVNGNNLPEMPSSMQTPLSDSNISSKSDLTKLGFMIGQTTQLISSFLARFPSDSSTTVVGLDLMLHQTMRVLVECAEVQEEGPSRLAISCLRHLVMSTFDYLSQSQWSLVIRHLEEAFRVCLYPLHVLTMVQNDALCRGSVYSTGLQVANLQPVTTTNREQSSYRGYRLRQLLVRLFQQESHKDDDIKEASNGLSLEDDDSCIVNEKQAFLFDLHVFPLSTHESDMPPLDVLSLETLVASLLNLRLLMQLIGEMVLSTKTMLATTSIQRLISPDAFPNPFDGFPSSPSATKKSSTFKNHISSKIFLDVVPLDACFRLLNCLADTYSTCFDFNRCHELKKLIQRLLQFSSPANLYEQMGFSSSMLQLVLLELAGTSPLSTEFSAKLTQKVRTAYAAFDEQLTKLKWCHFRRLPLNQPNQSIPVQQLDGAAMPPLCIRFQLEEWKEPPVEEMAARFISISLQLTQFYLYLLYAAKHSLKKLPGKRYSFPTTLNVANLANNGHSSDTLSNSTADKINSPTKNPKKRSSVRSLFTSNSTSPILKTFDASTCFPENSFPADDGIVAKEYAIDSAICLSNLARVLATVTEAFVTAPASPLRTVFTCNLARLIAVAEHPDLRRSLAAWFQSLVGETNQNTTATL